MSGFFTAASTQYLINSSPPILNYPFTVGMWINLTAVGSANRTLFALSDTGTTNNYLLMRMTTTETVVLTAAAGGVENSTTTSITLVAGTWNFVLGRFISSTNRRFRGMNAAGLITGSSTATARAPTGMDTLTIGALSTSGGITEPWDGMIGEVWYTNSDVWDSAANVPDYFIHKLAYNGPFSESRIAKDIVEYHALRQDLVSPDRNSDEDYLGAGQIYQNWRNTNGVTVGPHPPLLYDGLRQPYILRPRGIQQLFAGMAAGGGIDTTAPRAGTSTGVAVVSGKIAVLNEHRGVSTGVAVVTGREAVQDAKRSTVLGKAVVTGTASQQTTFTRSGTSTGVAVVTARDASQDAKRSTVVGKAVVSGTLTQQTQLSKSGSSIGKAVDTGREAVQDAKRSTVTGVAVVTGIATSTSSRDQSRSGTSTGVAVVTARDASQDAKRSTVAGVAAVAAKGAVQDAKRSTVLGKAVVTGVGTSSSEGGAQSRAGTSVGLAIVNARTAWMAEIAGHAIGVAIVNGVATSSGGAGTGDEARFNPLIASVAKLMNR